ncbi:GFA family protein [Pseudomonas sp. S75]|uniref:GFA family protein n=1 Tax=unclassified Pseudomonas TaxID=196821 RepID=UPI001903A8A4|nr:MULTISPECIES: GFA family protein [unclassified Pseudomonas]MBJ9974570.1 GFA family protein [Pseudomonas sp. S30]MBK0153349.1 GFA family protein [Pseudomonas sp. S75]
MHEVMEGGCHCGALRYRLEGDLGDVAHCHCSICRRVSGGLVVTWVTVPRTAFSWLAGQPQRYVAPASCTRWFCGRCGAHVALQTTHSEASIDVTVATMDRPEQVRANRHIWTGSRLPWLHLDEQLPSEEREQL